MVGDIGGDSEAGYMHAIAVAREQEAKILQLRTAVRLCRLWRRQGKGAEAHRLLSEIYNWFSEGFDISDLHEA